jgi:hypothetical protein
MPENVCCKDCGFLGVRSNSPGRELIEVDENFRSSGIVPHSNGQNACDKFPICSAGAVDLSLERSANDANGVAELNSRKRNCDSFTNWIRGFSPKEHREMLETKLMLDFREHEAEKDRNWRETQARADREWRASEAAKASHRHIQQLLVMGFLMIVAQIFAGWLSRDRSAELPKQTLIPAAQAAGDAESNARAARAQPD